jgi:Na+/proline symporter
MQSAGDASENQLLFKIVPRNKTTSAPPGELPKHAELIARFIRSRWLGFAGLACIPLVGWLDHKTGPAISFGLFYLPPVAMAAWFGGRRVGLIAAFASAATWFTAGIPESPQLSTPLIYCWNATTRLLIYSLVALLVAALRRQRDQLQTIIEQKNVRLELEMA